MNLYKRAQVSKETIADYARPIGDVMKMPSGSGLDNLLRARGLVRSMTGGVMGKIIDDADRARIENIKNVVYRMLEGGARRATNAGLGLADINPRDWRMERALSKAKPYNPTHYKTWPGDKAAEARMQGFVDKCAEMGVDPELLIKNAIDRDSWLWDILAPAPVMGAIRAGEGNRLRGAATGLGGGILGGMGGGLGGMGLGALLAAALSRGRVGAAPLGALLGGMAGSVAGQSVGGHLATTPSIGRASEKISSETGMEPVPGMGRLTTGEPNPYDEEEKKPAPKPTPPPAPKPTPPPASK